MVVRICVSQHISVHLAPNLRIIDQRGQKYTFLERFKELLEVQNFQNQTHRSYKRIVIAAEA